MYQSHVFRSQEEYDNHLQNTIFNKLIEACFEAGITVVVAAGNQGKHGVDVNSRVPAALAQSSLLPDLITVGSVGSSGTISPFTNADKDGIITVYANGEDIVAADYASNDGWTVASGTSEATAQVAGLVAYFLGRSDLSEQLHQGGNAQVAHNVKQYLISQAERYTNNGPLIANNGELSILQMLTCDLEQPSAAMLAVKRNAGFSLSTEAFTKEYEMVSNKCRWTYR